ncbi:hypothetical protein BT96DRAFT_948371 [Gymnopus androsaceus JB14]|uniref:FAD/NAD(P)-binding domain-containing protein n=1 Tax=Gymnopus androsaceus JB14 TaxID=1447944 RepID=A0A6A4GNR1_9AGAR|nr:hypothetical protein BT96DRAFT_948371 [Gymnopus androsaceus JB14]
MFILPNSTFHDKIAANPDMTETELLNSGNVQSEPAAENNITVCGAGIHGLIYVIHARKVHPDANLRISLFEKSPRPQWKASMQAEFLAPGFQLQRTRVVQYASKAARVKRFENFNTDAFFGYFEAINEDGIPEELEGFEAGHTSHICFPEGWMYLIRMLSWHDSPMENLLDMINYILHHAEMGTPHDEMPSKYKKLGDVMRHFALLHDYHGPGTSWYICKQLSYQSEVISGPGWVTVGDGIGFTNPLLSPRINAGMASTTFAAKLTLASLESKTEEERVAVWKKYDEYCEGAVPSLYLWTK